MSAESGAYESVRVIVGGNLQQARTFLQEEGWSARDCIVLGSPDRLRGVRGPVEVYRIGTYASERPTRYIDEVESNLAVIEATTSGDEMRAQGVQA